MSEEKIYLPQPDSSLPSGTQSYTWLQRSRISIHVPFPHRNWPEVHEPNETIS
jgi:hypothetical protein